LGLGNAAALEEASRCGWMVAKPTSSAVSMVADLGVAAARVRAPPAVQYERRGRGEGYWVE
jgi:hypothetical protein